MANDAPSHRSPIAGLRILVVEDEMLLAFDMVDELQRLGATPVGPLASVEQALSYLYGEEGVDAALVNVHLRGAESFPVVDLLRERAILSYS